MLRPRTLAIGAAMLGLAAVLATGTPAVSQTPR
jgi:hypothetical protein